MVQITSENLMQNIQSGSYFKLDNNGVLHTQGKIAHFFSNLFSKRATIESREAAIDARLSELINSSCTIDNSTNYTHEDKPIQKFISRFSTAGNALLNKYLKQNIIERNLNDDYINGKIDEYVQKQQKNFCGVQHKRSDQIKLEVRSLFNNININYNDLVNNEDFLRQAINTAVDISLNSQNAIVENVAFKAIKYMPFTDNNTRLQFLTTAKNISLYQPLPKDSQANVDKFLTDKMNTAISKSNEYNPEFDTNCTKNKIVINDSEIKFGSNDPIETKKNKILGQINNIKDDTLKTMISNIISPNSIDNIYNIFKGDVIHNTVHVPEIPNLGPQVQITKGNSFDDIEWHLDTTGEKPTLTCKCKLYLDEQDTHLGRAKCTMKMELDTQNKKVDNMNFSYSVEP